jgi:hypothetical protein
MSGPTSPSASGVPPGGAASVTGARVEASVAASTATRLAAVAALAGDIALLRFEEGAVHAGVTTTASRRSRTRVFIPSSRTTRWHASFPLVAAFVAEAYP